MSTSRQWAFLVYMWATEDLADDIGENFREIERGLKARKKDDLWVAVQVDDEADSPARRYLSSNGTLQKQESPGNTLPTRAPLEDFIDWAIKSCPAEKYCLILGGHSEGVDWEELPEEEAQGPSLKQIFAQEGLRVADLARALRRFEESPNGRLDILGLDACVMGMAEVHCELPSCVRIAVASSNEIPPAGWPYEQIVSQLEVKEDAHTLARMMVHEFLKKYANGNPNAEEKIVSLTACDLEFSRSLASSVDGLAQGLRQLLATSGGPALVTRWRDKSERADPPMNNHYLDLFSFCARLQDAPPARSGDLIRQAKATAELLSNHFVFAHEYRAPENGKREARGVTILFPDRDFPGHATLSKTGRGTAGHGKLDMKAYRKLKLSASTEWDEFLVAFSKNPSARAKTKPPLRSSHGTKNKRGR